MGLIKEIPRHPLNPGDVYVDPKRRTNPLLLVKILHTHSNTDKAYQLLGIFGVDVNSNKEYQNFFTKDEAKAFLVEREMVFARNIKWEINSLIDKAEKEVCGS